MNLASLKCSHICCNTVSFTCRLMQSLKDPSKAGYQEIPFLVFEPNVLISKPQILNSSRFFYVPSFKGFTSTKPTHERDGCCGFLNFCITSLLYFVLYVGEHTCMVCMFVHMCACVCTCKCMYTYTCYGAHVQVREQFARVPSSAIQIQGSKLGHHAWWQACLSTGFLMDQQY